MEVKIDNQKIRLDDEIIEEPSEDVLRQLEEYLSSERTGFNLCISFPEGFTGKVMREMVKIPYGETRTYGEIAEQRDTSAIAVGQACGSNPLPIIVPCHRIVGKNSLGGYHYGRKIKEKLLNLEAANLDN